MSSATGLPSMVKGLECWITAAWYAAGAGFEGAGSAAIVQSFTRGPAVAGWEGTRRTEPIWTREPVPTSPCVRGACTRASNRDGAGHPPVPPGFAECDVLASSAAWHPPPSR